MARWAHLVPSRTQQLSTVVAKVSPEGARIARCRAFFFYGPLRGFFSFCRSSFWRPSINKYVRAYACARTITEKSINKNNCGKLFAPSSWIESNRSKHPDRPYFLRKVLKIAKKWHFLIPFGDIWMLTKKCG